MPRSIIARSSAFATMAVALIVFSGCGYGASDRVPVHGKVMFDGAPVEDGTITFISTETPPVRAGGPIKNGTYSISGKQGPTPGTYRVEILVKKKTGRKVGTPGDPDVKMDEVVEMAPAKYNTNTTLTAEIKAKDNTIDFLDLKP